MFKPAFVSCFSIAFIVLAVAPGGAATTGLAYDSVTRINMGGASNGSQPPEPAASFDEAFDAAAKSKLPTNQGFNPFALGKLGKQIGDYMKNGTATRYAYLGSRERVDNLSSDTSEITDCAAGTRISINHANKTYRIESLYSTPSPGTPVPGTPAPRMTPPPDDGTRMNVKMTTAALGAKTIDTIPTQGYSADMLTTVTKPGQDPKSFEFKTLLYVSAYAQPSAVCPVRFNAPDAGANARAQSAAAYSGMLSMILGKDKRVTLNASGPPLPAGKLPIFQVVQPGMPAQGSGGSSSTGAGGFAFTTQNGHVHQISDADIATLFSPPADYKQVQ